MLNNANLADRIYPCHTSAESHSDQLQPDYKFFSFECFRGQLWNSVILTTGAENFEGRDLTFPSKARMDKSRRLPDLLS